MTGSGDAQAGREGAATDSAAPGPSSRRVTIQDVAGEAGVSISAVSKVLRDAYGVSPAMRAKVTATIERLGYRPHAGARGMRGRSYTIGVMLTELGSPFQPLLVQGIADELEPTPFQEILVSGGGVVPERQQRAVEFLLKHSDLPVNCRMRNVQKLSSRGIASRFDDCQQQFKLAKFHVRLNFSSRRPLVSSGSAELYHFSNEVVE